MGARSGRIELYVLADDYAGMTRGFLAQHGVSYLVKAYGEDGDVTILFDTGYDGEAVLHNMKLLGLSIEGVDYIVLSHNHYDHANGLPVVLNARSRKTPIPVVVGKGFFRESIALKPRLRVLNHEWVRSSVESLGAKFVEVGERLEIAPGISIPGIVRLDERLEFEKSTTGFYMVEDGGLVDDYVEHEVSLVVETGRGLVVIVGCSHPGVASIVGKVADLYGEKIYALIGGFHLINADATRISKTVAKLRELGVENIYTGHCTGLRAESMLLESYGEKFHRIYTGMKITI